MISASYDGVMRTLFATTCKQCNAEYFVPKHILAKTKYCSKACSQAASRRRITFNCGFCSKQFLRIKRKSRHKTGLNFCGLKCKNAAQSFGGVLQPWNSTTGESRSRYIGLRVHGPICRRCNYAKHVEMLDVDHIDGDRSNNAPDNLMVLCVWCHALKTRKIRSHNWNGLLV